MFKYIYVTMALLFTAISIPAIAQTCPVGGCITNGSGIHFALTGADYTVPPTTDVIRFTQSATIATQTVILPTTSVDGQAITFINYAGAITALTFNPAVNGWTNGSTFAIGVSSAKIRWDAASAAWYREQ